MATILIVDDAHDVREMLAAFAGSLGHTVLTAPNGLRGLQMVREARPDVLLLDVHMPGLSGLDVLATLRADGDADAPRPKVVVMTVSPDRETERRALSELGADAFVDKLQLDVPDLVALLGAGRMAA